MRKILGASLIAAGLFFSWQAAHAEVQHGSLQKVPCRDMGPGRDFQGHRILLDGGYLVGDGDPNLRYDILKVEKSTMPGADQSWGDKICTIKIR